jgi:hypothetical protein
MPTVFSAWSAFSPMRGDYENLNPVVQEYLGRLWSYTTLTSRYRILNRFQLSYSQCNKRRNRGTSMAIVYLGVESRTLWRNTDFHSFTFFISRGVLHAVQIHRVLFSMSHEPSTAQLQATSRELGCWFRCPLS